MKNIILSDTPPSKELLKKRALRLGMYSVREVESEDLNYAFELSKISHDFEVYYNIQQKN